MVERSLFELYELSRDIIFILYFFAFIYSFNTYMVPIKLNPNDENNPLADLVFSYANSFLYVQVWLIDKTKEKVINSINSHFNTIYDRLDYWKQQDENNTYCEVIDRCSRGSCGCKLHHYLVAWDKLRNDIQKEQEELIRDVNDYFDWLKTNTINLFQMRLFWSFILTTIFTKVPILAVELKELPKMECKKELKKIDRALLIIYYYNHHNKDIIKSKIRRLLNVSDNAVNLYLHKLKRYGFIYYDRELDEIIIKKAGYERINYLINKYNIDKWDFLGGL